MHDGSKSYVKPKSTRFIVPRRSATSTASPRRPPRPCSPPPGPRSSSFYKGIGGSNDLDSGWDFSEENLDGSSSFGRMRSDALCDIGSSGTNCTRPSCSTLLSPSATSDSSGRGACGSLTCDSSSLNCLHNLRHIIRHVQL